MSYVFTCQYCKCTFDALRSDAKYCTAVCRTRAANKRKEQEAEKQLEELERQKLLNKYNKLKVKHDHRKKSHQEQKVNIVKYQKIIKEANYLLSLPTDQLYPYYKKNKLRHLKPGTFDYHFASQDLDEDYKYQGASLLNGYIIALDSKRSDAEYYVQQFNKLVKELNASVEKLKELKAEIDKPSPTPLLRDLDLDFLLPNPKPKEDVPHKSYRERKRPKRRKRRPIPNQEDNQQAELGGEDVQNMQFDTYSLPGELGRFLGELDKNKVAFALTGDSGAGKSYFSFQLARLLLDGGMTVKYYSLEEGIGKLTQEKLSYYDIGNDLKITDQGNLSSIREDAEKYDALIIDSYSKITTKPEEFEKLRQNYPQTLFIIIFQKTTGKTIRGGSSIKYNSSATIDVQLRDGERVAVMEKGRYGTQGWIYSISKNRIIHRT